MVVGAGVAADPDGVEDAGFFAAFLAAGVAPTPAGPPRPTDPFGRHPIRMKARSTGELACGGAADGLRTN